MKKQLLFLLLVFSAAFGNMALAQTPTQMQYSLRLSDQAGKEISVKMELRRGTMDGEAAWFQQFDTTTDSNGTCTLTLDFGSSIDWGNGPYYIVAMVDGKEIGGSILTSVPYALRAASVDGFITKEELVGTWDGLEVDEGDWHYTISFNLDGTGTCMHRYSSGEIDKTMPLTWLLQNGTLVLRMTETSDEYGSSTTTESYVTTPTLKLSSTSFYMHMGYAYNTYLFTKKTEE